MPSLITRRGYWLAGIATVVVVLVLVTTLHLGTQISGTAQRTLYRETVEVVTGERDYEMAHTSYTQWVGDLATANPKLGFLTQTDTPVVQFSKDDSNHGYFVELADQSTGGAASFSVLMSDNNTAVLTCTGPGPLCSHGTFKLPYQDFALDTESQRELYQQTVTFLKAERAHASANGGTYSPYTEDFATAHSRLAFLVGPDNPVTQFSADSTDRGFFVELSNQATGGSSSFSVLMPDRGAAVLTCVGAAPLCSHGTFTLPAGTLSVSGAGSHK